MPISLLTISDTFTDWSNKWREMITALNDRETLSNITTANVVTLKVANTTVVSNLNADRLDGQHASFFVANTTFSAHVANTSNPHGVTAAQVGAYSTAAVDAALAGKQNLATGLTQIGALADPNADRILFWDDSANTYAYLTASTGLTISGTNITVRTGSETQTGILELATAAETATGTDTTRAVHPAGLASVLTGKQAASANLSSWSTIQPSSKLDASSYTAADVLSKLLTVDGSGSGIDADKWDGGNKTVSTSDPSGGSDGDVWFKYKA